MAGDACRIAIAARQIRIVSASDAPERVHRRSK
jgi:hypothetical protein